MEMAHEARSNYEMPLRYFLYLDTAGLGDDRVQTALEIIGGIYGGNINLPVSVWEIQKKRTRSADPLFGFYFEQDHLVVARLFSWQELADFGRTGVKLYPVRDIRAFFHELSTTFKYFKMANEDEQR